MNDTPAKLSSLAIKQGFAHETKSDRIEAAANLKVWRLVQPVVKPLGILVLVHKNWLVIWLLFCLHYINIKKVAKQLVNYRP